MQRTEIFFRIRVSRPEGGGGNLVPQGDVPVAKCCKNSKPLAVVAFGLGW